MKKSGFPSICHSLLRQLATSIVLCALCAAPARGGDARHADLVIPDQSGKVVTVLGPIQSGELGATVTHEHLMVDLTLPLDDRERWESARMPYPATEHDLTLWHEPFSIRRRGALLYCPFSCNRDALILDSPEDAIDEVRDFRRSGGRTIVDVTPIGVGRNPSMLRKISQATGVHVVMSTGFYRRAWHPDYIDRLGTSELVDIMVRDITRGADGTDIKAGIIGEIPAEHLELSPVESNEVRVLRAAARASVLTGAAISIHNYIRREDLWHIALDILEEEGADLSRVIMGHVTASAAADPLFLRSLLDRGVYLQFDLLGFPLATRFSSLDTRTAIDAILKLISHGHAGRILVSQDVCTKFQLHKNGGFGYDYVLTHFAPYLREHRVSERDISRILIENPARVLTFVSPRSMPRKPAGQPLHR